MSEAPDLLSLPNCLVGYLLSYLDATSLYLLSRTCTRFSDLIANYSLLWRHIDARRSPNDERKRVYCLNRAHSETHALLLREEKNAEPRIPLDSTFYDAIQSFSKLRILALEYQTIDGTQYTVTAFPSGLEELSLKNSNILFSWNFFRYSCDHMKNLRVLILDRCDWVCASDIVSISKYYKLEIFSISRCKNLKNSIPYFSLSGHGFKQLKVLDIRLSALGNSILQSLYKCPSLLAVYFQNEDKSYVLDFNLRKLQIAKGAAKRDYWEDEEEEVSQSLVSRDDINGSFLSDETLLTDSGLAVYSKVEHLNNDLKHPNSFLYVEPYSTCSCGYKGKGKRKFKEKKNLTSNDDNDDNDDKKPPGDHSFPDLRNKIYKLRNTVFNRSKRSIRREYQNDLSPGHSNLVISWSRPLSQEPHGSSHLSLLRSMHDRGGVQVINVDERLNNTPNQVNDSNRKSTKSCKRLSEKSSNEPITKKNKVKEDGAFPGTSSTINNTLTDTSNSSSESGISDTEEPPHLERPPTPHPDMEPLEPIECRERRDYQFVQQYILRADRQVKLQVPLRRLSLRGYRTITDMSLNYISQLELDILDLTYTDITEDAINLYLIDNPQCRVIHEKFCVCRPNLHF